VLHFVMEELFEFLFAVLSTLLLSGVSNWFLYLRSLFERKN
jgi:hypothetical protein